MDTDIRKPVSTKKAALIERPAPSASHTPTTLSDTEPQAPTYTEPLSEDEDDGAADHDQDDDDDDAGRTGDPMRRIANDEMGVTGLPAEALAQVEEARAFREQKNRENNTANANASNLLDPNTIKKLPSPDLLSASSAANAKGHNASLKADLSKLTPKNLKKLLAQKYEREDDNQNTQDNGEAGTSGGNGNGNGALDADEMAAGESNVTINGNLNQPVYDRSFTYAGKRIAVPVRVEPKVNFALERTLLVSVFFIYRQDTDFLQC